MEWKEKINLNLFSCSYCQTASTWKPNESEKRKNEQVGEWESLNIKVVLCYINAQKISRA